MTWKTSTALARLVEALRPWLGQLVLAGGWAHRLHRFHRLASEPGYLPLRTRDADIAFSPDPPLAGDVRAALEAAGFTEELLGDHVPPVTHYRLGAEDGGFYAEFLVPLHGGELKRSGAPNATLSMAGITAQRLRYLDLLLSSPWTVTLAPELGVPLESRADVLVPNAVSFLVQKLLIHGQRSARKKAHDVLYVHDTLELFGNSLDELRGLWQSQVRPAMNPRVARRAVTTGRALFREVTDTIREAALIPQDRRPRPENIRGLCHQALEAIFGQPT